MKSIFHFIAVGIVLMILSSCSWGKQEATTPTINNTSTGTQSISKLTGSVLPSEAQFKDIVTSLEGTKNYNDFSKEYSLASAKIDQWISDGSGTYIFDHDIVDKLVPYIYICKLTLPGDEGVIRASFLKYGTVIPPITSTDPANATDIIKQFTGSDITLQELYDQLLSSQVILPEYYIDLISKRKLSLGTISPDDCNEFILKYESAFFSEK